MNKLIHTVCIDKGMSLFHSVCDQTFTHSLVTYWDRNIRAPISRLRFHRSGETDLVVVAFSVGDQKVVVKSVFFDVRVKVVCHFKKSPSFVDEMTDALHSDQLPLCTLQ